MATKLEIEETEHTVRTLTRRAAGHGHGLNTVNYDWDTNER